MKNKIMQGSLTDQEIMGDILSTQKAVTGLYNAFSNECTHQPLREDFLNILREEHNIQASIFTEMKNRGWYAPAPAQEQMVTQARNKFQGMSQTM